MYNIIKDNGDRIYIRQPHSRKTSTITINAVAICLVIIAIISLI